jgi:hypothetical protein
LWQCIVIPCLPNSSTRGDFIVGSGDHHHSCCAGVCASICSRRPLGARVRLCSKACDCFLLHEMFLYFAECNTAVVTSCQMQKRAHPVDASGGDYCVCMCRLRTPCIHTQTHTYRHVHFARSCTSAPKYLHAPHTLLYVRIDTHMYRVCVAESDTCVYRLVLTASSFRSGPDSCPVRSLRDEVQRIAGHYGPPSTVRCWSVCFSRNDTATVAGRMSVAGPIGRPVVCGTFQFSCNRYCFNVKRQHKRNQVAWNADVVVGVVFQTCFDEGCRGFRSEPLPMCAVALSVIRMPV